MWTRRAIHWAVCSVLAIVAFTGTSRPCCGVFTEVGADLYGVRSASVAWGDYDGDGSLDLLVAGGAWPSFSGVYRNDGGIFTDINAGLTTIWHASAVWGDYDSDGDLDIAMGGNFDTRIYRNEFGSFSDSNAGVIGINDGTLAWGDCDNDGDLDLVVAGMGEDMGDGQQLVSKLYCNERGQFVDTHFEMPGVNGSSATWADYDNDGDLDFLLAGHTGRALTQLYRNDRGTFTEIEAGLLPVSASSAAWGDFDNDRDLDLLLAGYPDPARIYRNDDGAFVDIEAGLPPVRSTDSSTFVAWGDCDNDGDLDALLSGGSNTSHFTGLYRNDHGTFTEIDMDLPVVWRSSVAWGDYDNDQDLDFALAGWTGQEMLTNLYRNDTDTANEPPTAPVDLLSGVSDGSVTFRWGDATDDHTPSDGLSYNLRLGTSPGTDDVLSGMADTLTGRRWLPALGNVQQNSSWTLYGLEPGTYYGSVQAIDTAFIGSAWAIEQVVVVPEPSSIALAAIGAVALLLCALCRKRWISE